MSTLIKANTTPIRALDVRKDLSEVADLIELCFAKNMDAEGRDYIRYIRRVANNLNLLRWVPGAAERVSLPLHGYVWMEDGEVVGNLTLIPFFFQWRWIYLIANVAVHPDYRRRGIGRLLTERALDHIRDHHISEAWLQVRDDNPVALHLYQELGFEERVRRSTWQASPSTEPLADTRPTQIRITGRRPGDWDQQARWLQATYPPEVSWNLAFDWRRLRPGIMRALSAWINSENFIHWIARDKSQMIGAATWEPGRALSDMIWLGLDPDREALAIQTLLPHILSSRPGNNYLSINYPAGRGDEAFIRAGFSKQNTLIWMSIDYKETARNLNGPSLV